MMEIFKGSASLMFASPEGRELLNLYSLEAQSSLLEVKHNPDVAKYIQLEELGLLDVVYALNDGMIVGFITSLTHPMLHYSANATTVESFYVRPEFRKYGVAKELLSVIEDIAREKGSTNVFISSGVGSRLERACKSFGYTHTNTIHTKVM